MTPRRVRNLGHVQARPQKRRAATRVESAETRDYVSAPPLMSCMEQEAKDEKNMEELRFVPGAVSEPRWALQMYEHKCRDKGFKFFDIATVVSEGGAVHTTNSCKTRYTERWLEEDEAEVNGAKWRASIEQETSRGKLWEAFWCGPGPA